MGQSTASYGTQDKRTFEGVKDSRDKLFRAFKLE